MTMSKIALTAALLLGAASVAYASGDIDTASRYDDIGALGQTFNSGVNPGYQTFGSAGNPGYHHSLRGTTHGAEGAYARAPQRHPSDR